MKKFFVPLFFVLACLFFSCKQESGMSETTKKNLETAQAVAKMFESGDWSKVGDYIATDAVDHAGMSGDVKGLDSIKAAFVQMGNMAGNFKNETVKELADDEYVFQWLKETSTMKIDAMGMKAGSTNTFNALEVSKFKDGKIIEHWGFVNWNDMSKMMGNMSSMSMDTTKMKMDTAKHK